MPRKGIQIPLSAAPESPSGTGFPGAADGPGRSPAGRPRAPGRGLPKKVQEKYRTRRRPAARIGPDPDKWCKAGRPGWPWPAGAFTGIACGTPPPAPIYSKRAVAGPVMRPSSGSVARITASEMARPVPISR